MASFLVHELASADLGYLEPVPYLPSGCSEILAEDDFIMVAEFAEVEGPRPVRLIPLHKSSSNELNLIAVKIMAVDHHYHGPGDVFSIAKDMQVVMTDSQQDLAMLVHSFKLYDRDARGYVQPVCISYVSHDYNKIMCCYEDMSRLCYQIVDILVKSNQQLFVEEMEQLYEELVAELESSDMSIENGSYRQSTVERTVLEVRQVIECFGKQLPLSQHVENKYYTDGLSTPVSAPAGALAWKKPRGTCLRKIDELCSGADVAWTLLDSMYTYYSRTTAEIISHRNRYTMLEPAVGLLLSGTEPLLNMMTSLDQQSLALKERATGDDCSSNDYFYSVGSDCGPYVVSSSADDTVASVSSACSDLPLAEDQADVATAKASLMPASLYTPCGSYESCVDGCLLIGHRHASQESSPGASIAPSQGFESKSSRMASQASSPEDRSGGSSDAVDEREGPALAQAESKQAVDAEDVVQPAAALHSGHTCSCTAKWVSIHKQSPSSPFSTSPSESCGCSFDGQYASDADASSSRNPIRWQPNRFCLNRSLEHLALLHPEMQLVLQKLRVRRTQQALSGTLLRLAVELPFFPILVHSLLSGRPVIVVCDLDALPKRGAFVKEDPAGPLHCQPQAVVKALETLVPCCTAIGQLEPFYLSRESAVAAAAAATTVQGSKARSASTLPSTTSQTPTLLDVCRYKLVTVYRERSKGSLIGSDEKSDFAVAHANVLCHVTVLNLRAKAMQGPSYKGVLAALRSIRKEKNMQRTDVLELYLDQMLNAFAKKAFVLYHNSSSLSHFRDLDKCDVDVMSQYSSRQTALLRCIGTSADDMAIVKNMASLVERQQLDEYLSRETKCDKLLENQFSAPSMAAGSQPCKVYKARKSLSSLIFGR